MSKTDVLKETDKPSGKKAPKGGFTEQFDAEPAKNKKNKKKKKGIRLWQLFIIVVLLTLTLVYFGGVLYFSKHFTPNSYMNGYNVGMCSVKEVEDKLALDRESYELNVYYIGGEEKLKVGQGSLRTEFAAPVEDSLKLQNPFLWLGNIFSKDEFKAGYVAKFDKGILREYINGLEFMDVDQMRPSKNATVEMKDGEVVVTKAEQGNRLDIERTYEVIEQAINENAHSVDLYAYGCYVPPELTEDSPEIKELVRKCEDFLDLQCAVCFGDYKYIIPRDELSKIGYLSSNGTIQISQNNVESLTNRLYDKYATLEHPRIFTTHYGRVVTIEDGYYGWEFDPESLFSELYYSLTQKTDFEITPDFSSVGYYMDENGDIGNTYVEVDLSGQHVWMYVNGTIVAEADCVSGMYPSMTTPAGIYPIDHKSSPAKLVGENKEYETVVQYWIQFYPGIGLHDATWRGAFGGNIYTYDGSHGCVNLPYDAVATMYEYAEDGMPVILYW
ncbi:MAG: L,D-transpeptidase family protein [Lachnospiraceae bacterium]|nr:L,D-transpeptidase family protein [Lachnospiraceae bacterium]